MIRLERAFRLDADIFGLVGAQFSQLEGLREYSAPRHIRSANTGRKNSGPTDEPKDFAIGAFSNGSSKNVNS